MVCTAVYLYYGYKISENYLKLLFEKEYKEWLQNKQKNIKNKKKKNIITEYEFCHYNFSEYLIDKIKEKKYDHVISCTFLSCCAHDENSDWIIGIELGRFSGFDLKPQSVSILHDLGKYLLVLHKLFIDMELHIACNNELQLYSIADDCMDCS